MEGENMILGILIVLVLVILCYNMCGQSHNQHNHQHTDDHLAATWLNNSLTVPVQPLLGKFEAVAKKDTMAFMRDDDKPIVIKADPFLSALKDRNNPLDAYDVL